MTTSKATLVTGAEPPPAAARTSLLAPLLPAGVQRVSSQAIFQGAQEVEIEHNSAVYRLRQTSLGKLILTK